MQAMALAHQQQLQQLQPKIKSFASPSITPSGNLRVGLHHQQIREQANLSINTISQGNNNNSVTIAPTSIRNEVRGSSNIQGRRSSPEVKVAVNREIQDHRPHTAGHPLLQYNSAAQTAGSKLSYNKNEEFFTIMNNQGGGNAHHATNNHTAINSAQNTITLSNNHHNQYQANGLQNLNPRHHRGQPSQSHHENKETSLRNKNRANMTLQHDESAGIRSGRQKLSSKSQHPNQRKKKTQTSRSAPRGHTVLINNFQPQLPNQNQLININIGGGSQNFSKPHTATVVVAAPSTSQNLNKGGSSSIHQIGSTGQRKRANPAKFHSQGGNLPGSAISGLMSAPTKSKSRSRSQKRKQEITNGLGDKKATTSNQKLTQMKPPRQLNHLNRSSINHQKDTLDIAGNGVDNAFSFDHKDNDSLNFNEISPSRIVESAPADHSAIVTQKNKTKNDINTFLDSDSSISSPKSLNNNNLLHAVEAASSGPQKVKGYYMDKGAFLKHFSPNRNIPHDGQAQHLVHHQNQQPLISDRERHSSRGGHAAPKGKAYPAAAQKKISLRKKLVDQLMRENFKQLKAKEEADEMRNRKLQNDALIQKELLKKAQELHQTSQRAINNLHKSKMAGVVVARKCKNVQASSGAQIKTANQRGGMGKNYKKTRSHSCMNQTDNIFEAQIQRSKEMQQHLLNQGHIANLSNPNFLSLEPPKAVETYQPKQPTQQPTQKRRDKSFIHEIKELNRICNEELKKEIKFGQIEGGMGAGIQNKRPANMTKKDQKHQVHSANTQVNQQSQGEIHGPESQHNQLFPKKIVLNPTLTEKIKGYKEKKGWPAAKTMEHTITQEKKKKIKVNLSKLDERIQHLRHNSFNFVVRRTGGGNQNHSHGAISTSHRPEQQLQTSIFDGNSQFKPQRPPKIFDYKGDIEHDHHHPAVPQQTPSKILDMGDLSHEFPDDYQKLLLKIEQGHELYHESVSKSNHNVSKSNPPPDGNRRSHNNIEDHHNQTSDPFSLDASSIQYRDSSLNNRRRLPESKQNITVPQVRIDRKPLHHSSSNQKSSNKGDGRSNSSPNTVTANNDLLASLGQQSNSDSKTFGNSNSKSHPAKGIGAISTHTQNLNKISDPGSNSNKSAYEIQHKKIKEYAKFYMPNIMQIMREKNQLGKISKTQMLVMLHAAAIIIQQQFRKYKARKGFYTNSLTYINTSEDETLIYHKDTTTQLQQKKNYPTISPDRFSKILNPAKKPNEIIINDKIVVANPFSSLSSSIEDKVVQISVINSSEEQSLIVTPNNQVKANNHSKICSNNIDPQSKPQTILSTVFQNQSIDTGNISSVMEEEKKQMSPGANYLGRETPSKDSSSRRNIVPPLNLSKIDLTDKNAQPSSQQLQLHNPILHTHETNNHQASRTVFERHSFQDFQELHNNHESGFDMNKYPDMLQMLEEIIKRKGDTDQRLLNQQLKDKKCSPRTYNIKKIEIESWVSKEKEEVKKQRKRYEEEFQKTRFMISEVQKNTQFFSKILNEPQSSTHRSRLGQEFPGGGDVSNRGRADSNMINSARPNDKPYLDTLQEQQNLSRRSSLPPEEITNNFANNLSHQISLEDHNKDLSHVQKSEAQHHLPNQNLIYYITNHQKPQGSNIIVKDGSKYSEDEDDGQHHRNQIGNDQSSSMGSSEKNHDQDIGQTKGLSRTKGSIQLDLNNEDSDSNHDHSREQNFENTNNITKKFLDDNNLSSDPRGNKYIDTSQENGSPLELQNQIKSESFFINNFESGNAKNVLDQIKKSSPTNNDFNLLFPTYEDQRRKEYSNDGPSDNKPALPSLNQIPSNPVYYHDYKPAELDDIKFEIQGQIDGIKNNAPVSPISNPDIPIDTLGSAQGGLPVGDNHIITGGASLNSTLSAGNESGLPNELTRAIKDAKQDQLRIDEEEKKAQDSTQEQESLANQITDEIYQNLLGELRLDLELLLLNDPRVQNIMPRQSETRDKTQLNLGDSGRFPIFDRRGIQTDLFAIERYVEEVLQEVLCERENFMQNMIEPIKKSPRDILNQLQNSEIGSYEHFEQHYPPVLPLETYLKLERRRKEQRILEQSEGGSNMSSPTAAETRNFLAECEHIHNKTLFDCINDSLLQFKPYAKDGEPLPWSRQNRRLKPTEEFTVEEMFEIVKHDLFRWAIIQAGTLPRREFVFGGLFDEELFAEIREKKLATLLAREMIENEPRWLNYEFEDAQVKIDIGDMILEQLVTETITILNDKMSVVNEQ